MDTPTSDPGGRWPASPLGVLLVVAALGWAALVFGDIEVVMPPLCMSGASWSGAAAAFGLIAGLTSPAALLTGVAVMVAAMMAPLLDQPLRRLCNRASVQRRGLAAPAFVLGYAGVWMIAGLALEAVALGLRLCVPERGLAAALGGVGALVWQVSPWKRLCLDKCHEGPDLQAFGRAPGRAALLYGVTHATGCVGACWALMLLPPLCHHAHLAAMAAVAAFLFVERREPRRTGRVRKPTASQGHRAAARMAAPPRRWGPRSQLYS